MKEGRKRPERNDVRTSEEPLREPGGSKGSNPSNELSRRKFLSRGAATAGVVAAAGIAGPGLLGKASPLGPGVAGAATASSKAGIGKGTPRRGGSAILGTTADIDGFYPPANHWDVNGYLYANSIYDPLTAVGADGQIRPYLAQSVTPNADKTVWTITLRPNVTFSDGSALDATVLKNNLDALKSSALTGTALKPIEGFAVSGPMSVDVTCRAAVGGLPLLPRHPGRLHRGPVHDRRRQRTRRRRLQSGPGHSPTPRGTPTTTSPPPGTPTIGGAAIPTWTRSPSSPSPTRPSVRPR